MSHAYRQLLTDFAHAVGLEPVDHFLDSEEVVIDDVTISLYFEGDEALGDVVFFALLGAPGDARLNDVALVLLEANYLWAGTGGATLGLNAQTGQVALSGRMPLDTLDGDALASLLAAFADSASFWGRFVRGELPADQAQAAMPSMNFALRA